ncbi:Cobalt-zinc-cadmium resistance protein CzcA [Dyella terrae]|nr:Cobalt-zinc-cadmium resistance protein CzcA [Dyella terrae]
MFRGLVAFALTRRAIVLMALAAFTIAGLVAYAKLNIEAYPNPAPVILEITAQAPGLSAEEMERTYTRPMEVGLATTPGVESIRSTSFYGLSFVRVTFKYGTDYYFDYTQAALSLQQNVTLPNNVQPQIQASSLVGEVFRYQLVGPPSTSLTELRTLQDWVVTRRLLSVPGIAQVVTWGGTTKEYDVEADLHKLQGYGITLPQLITAIGNANSNVGGRTINIGQQSVNIRGVGLVKDVGDIGNIVLNQSNGTPVLVKDVAKVEVGAVPRLGRAGRDKQDDVVTGIVVMNRTLQTNEVVARVKEEVAKLNSDGTLPAGVKLVPFYDRSTLVSVTTHTVLHNLIFGCLLVFLIQWIFLGDLRSAIIVSANIPVALFFSIIILVLMGDSANLLSLGAVDFGIIVDSAVILIENIFRNFQKSREEQHEILHEAAQSDLGTYMRGGATHGWTDRLRLLFISAMQVDRAVLFSSAITVAAFIPPVHHAGCGRPDLQPDGAHLCLCIDWRTDRHLHHLARAGLAAAAQAREGNRDIVRAGYPPRLYTGAALGTGTPPHHRGPGRGFSAARRPAVDARGHRVPAGAGGRQPVDTRLHAAHHFAGGRPGQGERAAPHPAHPSRSGNGGVAAWPPRRR